METEESKYFCVMKSDGKVWHRVTPLGARLNKDQANDDCKRLKKKDERGAYAVFGSDN